MNAELVVGGWSLHKIPFEWEALPGFGVRRTGKDNFASVLFFAQELLPSQMSLRTYVVNQMEGAKLLLPGPTIKGPDLFEIPGASEAMRLTVSYRSADGRAVVQLQIYAIHGQAVGNATITTLQEELPNISSVLGDIVRSLSFGVS